MNRIDLISWFYTSSSSSETPESEDSHSFLLLLITGVGVLLGSYYTVSNSPAAIRFIARRYPEGLRVASNAIRDNAQFLSTLLSENPFTDCRNRLTSILEYPSGTLASDEIRSLLREAEIAYDGYRKLTFSILNNSSERIRTDPEFIRGVLDAMKAMQEAYKRFYSLVFDCSAKHLLDSPEYMFSLLREVQTILKNDQELFDKIQEHISLNVHMPIAEKISWTIEEKGERAKKRITIPLTIFQMSSERLQNDSEFVPSFFRQAKATCDNLPIFISVFFSLLPESFHNHPQLILNLLREIRDFSEEKENYSLLLFRKASKELRQSGAFVLNFLQETGELFKNDEHLVCLLFKECEKELRSNPDFALAFVQAVGDSLKNKQSFFQTFFVVAPKELRSNPDFILRLIQKMPQELQTDPPFIYGMICEAMKEGLRCQDISQLPQFTVLVLFCMKLSPEIAALIEELFLTRITTSHEEIQKNPKQLLINFYYCSTFTRKLPKITYNDSEGIDATGLTRDFIATLFKALCNPQDPQFSGKYEKDLLIPLLSEPKNPSDGFVLHTIGILFGAALSNAASITVGMHFHPVVFQMIHAIEQNELHFINQNDPFYFTEETKDLYNRLAIIYLKNLYPEKFAKPEEGDEALEAAIHRFLSGEEIPAYFLDAGMETAGEVLEALQVKEAIDAILSIVRPIGGFDLALSWEQARMDSPKSLSDRIQGTLAKEQVAWAWRIESVFPSSWGILMQWMIDRIEGGLPESEIARPLAAIYLKEWHPEIFCGQDATEEEIDAAVEIFLAEEKVTNPFILATLGDDKGEVLQRLGVPEMLSHLFSIAKSMKQWTSPQPWPKIDQIQGALSKEEIQQIFDPVRLRTWAFLIRWIEEASQEEIEKLVQAITGSSALSLRTLLNVHFYDAGNAKRMPDYHTCPTLINLPRDYPDYATFKERLTTSLLCLKGESGFQSN